MSETLSLKLPLLVAEQAQKHVTHNEALRALDALVQLSVKDRDLATPPGSPAEGDRYIVAASPTGVWSGHAGDVAVFQDGAWAFHDPKEGWRCWVEDENVLLIFDGPAWSASIGALLGVGTTADATNPFSAKLNKALWTAKTAAEGGDGDLRYTLNKETTADVLSLLLQKGFSGRAEIGLIGDDDLLIKVSADGSAFVNALRFDKTTGLMTHADGIVPRLLSAQHSGSTNNSSSGSGSYQNHTPTFSIPANFITSNRVLRVTVHWTMTTGSAAPTLSYRLRLGGTVVAEITGIAPSNNMASRQGVVVFLIQGTAAPGASANVLTTLQQGNFNATGQTSGTAQPVALATNGALALDLGTSWATAGTGTNTIALTQLVVEALN
jgi:hypothetical protein